MRVGLIGLGRMGEGMSRRMMKAGIEVWGYRRNYDKAQEAYESGYVSGITTSIQSLVQIVRCKQSGVSDKYGPGIFMMVVPAETVEETIDELLRYCGEGDIIIDHGNSNFKDSRKRAERLAKLGIQYIDCGTSGGVYGLDRGYCLMVGGGNTAVATCSRIFDALAPGINAATRTQFDSDITSAEHGWLHCGGPGAGHFVKMVHNGIEYGIMQAYAEGFNIHGAIKGPDSIKQGIDILKRYKINITANSHNFKKELFSYIWKKDKTGKMLNEPIDAFNHLIDPLRYVALNKLASKIKQEYSFDWN